MIDAGAFPAPIANSIQAWEAETAPFPRLIKFLICLECVIRYAAILAVSEFRRARLEREFPDVDTLIRDVIQRPGLGHWLSMYREAARAFRKHRPALVCDALYRFGFNDTGRSQPIMQIVDRLTRLRNKERGHGGVPADEECLAILDEHEPHLRDLLDAAEFTRELVLYVIHESTPQGIVAGRLMGPVEGAPPREAYPAADDAPGAGRVAARHSVTGRWIDLSPLVWYLECDRDVERKDRSGTRTRARCGRPGVFFHDELVPPSRVFGFEFRESHHCSWRFPSFDFVRESLDRFRRRTSDGSGPEWYTGRIADSTRYFVGREDSLERLGEIARGERPQRAAFVSGAPGIGKSSLLARWITLIEADKERVPALHVFRHFIQDQYPETGHASRVFDVLRLQLCERFALDPAPPRNDGRPRAELYRAALLESLARVMHVPEPPSIALVIDGLDEAGRSIQDEESPLRWLPGTDMLPQGVTLVMSGRETVRQDPLFKAKFGSDTTTYLELDPLEATEVQEWFDLALGPVYAVRYGAFLEHVARIAGGHPQYLHFVRRALLDGSLQPQDWNLLPSGMPEFYDRVEKEAASADPQARSVIALLAQAEAPLDLDTMALILEKSVEEVAAACDAARNVLSWDRDGNARLFHAEFAQWARTRVEPVRSEDALRNIARDRMSDRLVAWCRDWSSHRNPYAASHLVAHLYRARCWDEIEALARNAEFLRFQSSLRPDTPELPLTTFSAAMEPAFIRGDYTRGVEFALRRIAWSCATLEESPVQALRSGSLERARRLADLHDLPNRLAWYFELAAELATTKGPAAAESLLALPGRLPWWNDDTAEEIGGLFRATHALPRLRDLPSFQALWRHYLTPTDQELLVVLLLDSGASDLAEAVVTEMDGSPAEKSRLWLVRYAVTAKHLDRARRLAGELRIAIYRDSAEKEIAAATAPGPRRRDPKDGERAVAAVRYLRPSPAETPGGAKQYLVRMYAELLLRLLALDAVWPGDVASEMRRRATTAAAEMALEGEPSDDLTPSRRDLLWHVARRSWHARDLAGAFEAAWKVEWTTQSKTVAVAFAIVIGTLLGLVARPLSARVESVTWMVIAILLIAAGSVAGALVIVTRMRSAREALLTLPVTCLAVAWIIFGPGGPGRVLLPLALLSMTAFVGIRRSKTARGWLAVLLKPHRVSELPRLPDLKRDVLELVERGESADDLTAVLIDYAKADAEKAVVVARGVLAAMPERDWIASRPR